MTDVPSLELKRSPLHAVHEAAGASFTDFAGWQMPVRYSSDLAEHHAVRTAAGIFDISHMAEFTIEGPEAAAYLDYALAGQPGAIEVGQAKYTLMLTQAGGIVDDLIVYRQADEEFLVIANAGNHDPVLAALRARAAGFRVSVTDKSDDIALIAVQGPASLGVLKATAGLSAEGLDELGYYRHLDGTFEGVPLFIARTGYTGEDGFELYLPVDRTVALWTALTRPARPLGLVPAGLASRDTLRLEAGMPLYGHELGPDVFPEQAGLGRVVAMTKDSFVGTQAIEAGPGDGRPRARRPRLRGQARRPRRLPGALAGTTVVGEVTSGALSPTLGHPIAMAYVDRAVSAVGTPLQIDVRGSRSGGIRRRIAVLHEGEVMAAPEELQYTAEHEWVLVDGRRSRPSASPPTPPRSSATSSSSTCRRWARRSPRARSSARSSRRSRSASSSPRSTAPSSRPTRPSSTSPELVNADPFGAGWLIKVEFAQLPELLSLDAVHRADRMSDNIEPAAPVVEPVRDLRRPPHRHGCRGPGVHARRARLRLGRGARRRRGARRHPDGKTRTSIIPPPASERATTARAARPRRPQPREPLDDRPRLLRHDHPRGHQAQRAREPELVHAYTPYQPEISQGRLEALLNFQTMVADLTGLATANASMLDESTAVVEGMLLARRASGSTSNVFLVDADALPQTKALLRNRAAAVGIELDGRRARRDRPRRPPRVLRRLRPVPGRLGPRLGPERGDRRASRRRAASPSSPPTCSPSP